MKALRLILGAWVVLALAGVSVADDKTKPPAKDEKKEDKKDNKEFKEKMVGTWELVSEDFSWKKGTLIKFTKDGKLNFRPPGEKKGLDGTYKLDGDKLTMTMSKIAAPALTVDKITDEDMLTSFASATQKWRKK
jgi:uncharacterized protein (TIGR03066 family)